MQNDVNKKQLFYEYYHQWIEVYKRGAIREATMAKYLMTLKWVKKLAPDLQVAELTRTTYQKLLNELDAAFLFKHVKRTPGVHHETEKISNLLEQLGMPDVLSNTQKLIDMVTGFPPSADASP